jgi:hypothetical protein
VPSDIEIYSFVPETLLKYSWGYVDRCPVLTKHHAMKAYWGSGDIAPLIL